VNRPTLRRGARRARACILAIRGIAHRVSIHALISVGPDSSGPIRAALENILVARTFYVN
jgi:hypothetical protein